MIAHLVSNLPEVYQPVYGHPELSSQVSRPSQDRFEIIAQIHDSLQRLLDRPLNVLDLGCAQGYFSLNLAERGASVRGVDFLDKNVLLCQALAEENPLLNAVFEIGRAEDVIMRLEPDRYDLVLGLSVFHHIVHEQGVDTVSQLLDHAAELSAALIVELALREEPLYWGPSQPQDSRTLLDAIAFVHETGRHSTHLSPIARPLYVASNRYWLLDGQAGQFDSWTSEPHALAHGVHGGSRRYFSNSTQILKQYRYVHPSGAHNKPEFTQEKQFLENPPSGYPVPALAFHGENNAEAWIVMERLPGKLLLDLLQHGANIDHCTVLLAVLGQLSILEAAGLCHNDVRTWNILVAEDGATHLIDYGSISPKEKDVAWPSNPYFAFFILVHEVVTGRVDNPNPLRTIALSPFSVPLPYQSWARQLWQRPLAEWSFRLMRETLLQAEGDLVEEGATLPVEAWMSASEEAMQTLKVHFSNEIKNVHDRALQAGLIAQQAEVVARSAEIRSQQAEATARTAESRSQQAEATARAAESHSQQAAATAQSVEQRVHQIAAELQRVYASRSWRITGPLRWLNLQAKLLRQHGLRARTTASLKRLSRLFLAHAVLYINNRPRLRSYCIKIAQKTGLYPILRSLYHELSLRWAVRQIALHLKLYVSRRPRLKSVALFALKPFPTLTAHLKLLGSHSTPLAPGVTSTELEQLSPRARQIYHDLRDAIERRRKEQN